MPQRKNNNRKAQLESYKNQHKRKNIMSDKLDMPTIKPFRQVPIFEKDSQFTITGDEFETLQEFLNVFVPPIRAAESVFKRAIEDKKVTFKYIDNEGNEVPNEDVQNYLVKLGEYYRSLQEAPQSETPSIITDETEIPKEETPKGKVRKLKTT